MIGNGYVEQADPWGFREAILFEIVAGDVALETKENLRQKSLLKLQVTKPVVENWEKRENSYSTFSMNFFYGKKNFHWRCERMETELPPSLSFKVFFFVAPPTHHSFARPPKKYKEKDEEKKTTGRETEIDI